MTFDLLTENVFFVFFLFLFLLLLLLFFFYPDRLRSRCLNRLDGEN